MLAAFYAVGQTALPLAAQTWLRQLFYWALVRAPRRVAMEAVSFACSAFRGGATLARSPSWPLCGSCSGVGRPLAGARWRAPVADGAARWPGAPGGAGGLGLGCVAAGRRARGGGWQLARRWRCPANAAPGLALPAVQVEAWLSAGWRRLGTRRPAFAVVERPGCWAMNREIRRARAQTAAGALHMLVVGVAILHAVAVRWTGRVECPACGAPSQDSWHRFWVCPAWQEVRRSAGLAMEPPSAPAGLLEIGVLRLDGPELRPSRSRPLAMRELSRTGARSTRSTSYWPAGLGLWYGMTMGGTLWPGAARAERRPPGPSSPPPRGWVPPPVARRCSCRSASMWCTACRWIDSHMIQAQAVTGGWRLRDWAGNARADAAASAAAAQYRVSARGACASMMLEAEWSRRPLGLHLWRQACHPSASTPPGSSTTSQKGERRATARPTKRCQNYTCGLWSVGTEQVMVHYDDWRFVDPAHRLPESCDYSKGRDFIPTRNAASAAAAGSGRRLSGEVGHYLDPVQH